MNIKDVEVLYDYGYWANKKLFQVVSGLTQEQFAQPVAGSYGSIRNTLVHAMSAEWGWLERCGGKVRGPRLTPDNYPTLPSLVETWDKVEAYIHEFLSTLRDEDMSRDVGFSLGGPETHTMQLGHLMQHAAMHGIHHRAQVAMLLRMLGYEPGNFDMLVYYSDKA